MSKQYSVVANIVAKTEGFVKGLNEAKSKASDFHKNFESKTKALQQGLDKTGKFLMKNVTAPIVALGTVAFVSAKSVDDATNLIRQSTGKTGKEFDKLKDSFKNVFANAPDDAETVANVLSKLNVATDATGKKLEELTSLTLDYAKVNRVDAAQSAETLGRLMNALEVDISTMPSVMDKLTKASQLSGIGVNELASYVIEAGPAFEEMGFGLEKSIGLFASFHKAGANPKEVLSSLNIVLNKMAKDGATNAEEAFKSLLEKIKAAPDILSATTIASEAFGAKVGAKVAEDIRAGRFEVDEWVEALKHAGGTVEETAKDTETFGEKLAILRNKATLAFEPFGAALIDVLEKLIISMQPLLDMIQRLAVWFSNLSPSMQTTIVGLTGLIAAIAPLLLAGSKLISTFGLIGTGVKFLIPLFGGLSAPILAIVAGITALTIGGIALVNHLKKDAIPAIDLFGKEVSDTTKEVVGGFLDLNDKATQALQQLSWSGQNVTKEMKDSIVSNIGQMGDQIVQGLNDKKDEAVNVMQELFAKSTEFSEEEQRQLIENVTVGYEERTAKIQEGEQRIKEILELASEENRALKESEKAEINRIQDEMVQVGIEVLTENQREQQVILERMKQQAGKITAQQAVEVVKNSLEQKEKVVAEAEEQYNKSIAEIIKLRDEAGVISEEQAQKLIDEATRQRDETVKQAEDMHEKVVAEAQLQAEEHVNHVNWETGEVLSKWELFKNNTSKKWSEIKQNAKDKWNEMWIEIKRIANEIKDYPSKKFEELRSYAEKKFNEIKEKITKPVEEAKDKVFGWIEDIKGFFSNLKLKFPKIEMPKLPHFKLNGSFSLNPPSVPKLSVDWYAKGAIFTKPTIFNTRFGLKGFGEAGAEAALPLNDDVLGTLGKMIAQKIPHFEIGKHEISSFVDSASKLKDMITQFMNSDNFSISDSLISRISTNTGFQMTLPKLTNDNVINNNQSVEFNIDKLIHVEGNVDEKSVINLERASKNTVNKLVNEFKKLGFDRRV